MFFPKTKTVMLAVLLIWLVGGQRTVFAQNILDWCDDSQVVCVATAGASAPSQIVYNGTEPVLPICTQFTLKRATGKGAPGAIFAVVSYDYTWNYPPLPGEISHRSPVPFQQGETYLLFLTRAPRFGVERPGLPLRLSAGDAFFHPSFLTLGARLPPSRPTDSPLRAILWLLLASLDDTTPSVQAEAVSALGSYGPFLWDYAAYPNLVGSFEGRRQTVPDQWDIVLTLEQTAIPMLIKRLHGADAGDRRALLVALGCLQDVDVIPQLVAAATTGTRRSRGGPLAALSSYEVPAALPLLSKEFLSADPALATACINSVMTSRDVKAVPMLIDALLHNPNVMARCVASEALNEATGLENYYSSTEFPAHEQEADRFWRDWLKNNPPKPTS